MECGSPGNIPWGCILRGESQAVTGYPFSLPGGPTPSQGSRPFSEWAWSHCHFMDDEAGTHVGTTGSGPLPQKSHTVDRVANTKQTLVEVSKLGHGLEELSSPAPASPAGQRMPAPSPFRT